MLKQAKRCLMLCLIALQFVAPFIHAHAFGHDSFSEHAFHLHADELINPNLLNVSLDQAQLGHNEIAGAITTVASGIKNAVADDIADGIAFIAIFFTLLLLSFNRSESFVWQPIQALLTHLNFYSPQRSRAPPR